MGEAFDVTDYISIFIDYYQIALLRNTEKGE